MAWAEKTAKFTFGGLLMTTAGKPADCSTVKDAESLVEVSFAVLVLAAATA
mgnify:CR=1 FL=1